MKRLAGLRVTLTADGSDAISIIWLWESGTRFGRLTASIVFRGKRPWLQWYGAESKKGPSRKCKTSTAAEPDEKTSTSSENRLTRMIYLFVESTQMQHPVTSTCFLRFQFRRIRPNWPDNRSNVRDWDIPWGWDLLNPTNTRPTWLDGKPKCISRFSLLIVAIVSQPGFSFFWISELINFVVHWLGHGNPL